MSRLGGRRKGAGSGDGEHKSLSPTPSSVLSPPLLATYRTPGSDLSEDSRTEKLMAQAFNGHGCPSPGKSTPFIPSSLGPWWGGWGSGMWVQGPSARDFSLRLQLHHCRCLPALSVLHKPCFHSSLPRSRSFHGSHRSQGQFMGPGM